ncbi:type-III integral membrane protein of unknown function [Rhizoctonia solani]|uniref:B box-type domain-containing protein n=1 Tax=Rhizoctonia solani TaxID=456999 RepID=A0A8H8P8G9_9AGAM|nr:type-III integral membrane protein of unknown function [Rhizoctonia solani]QRW26242.1 type-III integral membrane protein of unknown function [Rhizoctonia solani]
MDSVGILDNPDAFEAEMTNGDGKVEEEEAVGEDKGAEEGYCVECEDQPASVYCETCADDFCDVCYEAQHRKGTRKLHKSRPLELPSLSAANDGIPAQPDTDGEPKDADADESVEDDGADEPVAESSNTRTISSLAKRAKSIPLRLTLQERKLLRLLESALHVSEYTDRVDILSYNSSRTKRAAAQIRELCSILSGLCLAADYKAGQELFEGRDFAANEAWFARVFEIGRRHKIMNPDKMRETYGKLIYLLMDARSPDVSDLLGFSPISPLVTVYSTLEAHDALAVLEDPRLEIATREIISPPGASGRVRAEVQRNIKEKERAVEALVNEYAAGECIYSISDNSAFLRVNRDPCEIMIGYLKKYFHPTKCTPTKTLEDAAKVEQPSLAIKNGRNGARLSHDHSKQYTYVLQSLTLWREILGDMFHLWTLAETDLLSTTSMYRLRDTGQGLNRVQHAPKTSREMHAILGRAQRDLGSWVGSSVIHMGDHNVPNALLFIDKYSKSTASSCRSQTCYRISPMMREFGIMRSAFDGSGADSYFDAGSCIDGRLTSGMFAWHLLNGYASNMLHLRQLSEQCKDYITRSLVSSLELENRLRTASSSDLSRPLDMKFHNEWRHPDCPVNQWYIQQTSSSTQTLSIQHWRNRKTPYRHEYLLIRLADGSIYRLERLGQGSRAAAISRKGCAAHDIIQRFPPHAYRNTLLATDPSELVVELDARSFDLLDRFNSNFLCATVLIILARRVAKWESRVTEDEWLSIVDNTINRLQSTTADAHEFFGLTISAMINSDQPTPRKFILDSIRSELEGSGHRSLNIEVTIVRALNSSDPCAIRFKETLQTEVYHDSPEDLKLSEFRRSIVTKQSDTLLDSLQTSTASVTASYTMDTNENPVPWIVHIRSSLHTSSFFFTSLRHFGEFRRDLIPGCSLIAKGKTTWRTFPHVIKLSHIHNIKSSMKGIPQQNEVTYLDDAIHNDITDSVITNTYTLIQQHVAADDYAHRVLIVANGWLNKKIWTRCLSVCVSGKVEEGLNMIFMRARLNTIETAQQGQAEVQRLTPVLEFIKDILRQIQAHATEIEALGLATATLIQNDIEETMSEIWRFLPNEYGYEPIEDLSIPDTEAPPYEPISGREITV